MKQQWRAFIVCMGMLSYGNAHADIKVLFKFDSSGVKANRIIDIEGSGENYPASLAELAVRAPENLVILTWLDANGETLAVTRIIDPRVTSSPEHMNPSVRSRVGLDGGAWACDGPDGAESVLVEFPENSALGLMAETWPVSLRQDNLEP